MPSQAEPGGRARRALVIGGTGQIGKAVVAALIAAGWHVTAVQRGSTAATRPMPDAGVHYLDLDRRDTASLLRALGPGADVVIDTIAMDGADAAQLVAMGADAGRIVAISSAAIYADAAGVSLVQSSAPRPALVPVDHPTVAPGDGTYAARKAMLEAVLRAGLDGKLTLLRAGALYGVGSPEPREWWLVRRLLDGRTRIPLAFNGDSRLHVCATVNLAALIVAALDVRGTHVLNAGDEAAPRVLDLCRNLADAMERRVTWQRLAGPPRGQVGRTPWSVAQDLVLDMAPAAALGYRPVVDHACSAVALASDLTARRTALAGAARGWSSARWFDYEAEDRMATDRRA